MPVNLTIGGLPICGAINAKFSIPTSTAWDIYTKWVAGLAEKDAPLCVLHNNVTWLVNGKPIDIPDAWFMEFDDLKLNNS